MIDGISIIIATHNRAGVLGKALRSVQSLRVPAWLRAELLVVDNLSTDETPDVVEEIASNAQIPVRRVAETRQGLSWARNRGILEASHEHLVFLDDDMVVDPGWLEGYVEAHRIHSPCCVVGPVTPQFEEDPPEWLTKSMFRSVTGAYSRKGEKLVVLTNKDAHQLPGCNFSVLRSAAIAVGGFTTQLGRVGSLMLGGEDWEFGEKIVERGERVVYAPKCGVRHFIDRKKISRDGLRARWEGMGATERAWLVLRGERISLRRRAKGLWWMSRCLATGRFYRIIGDKFNAFHWELRGLFHFGFLFKAPPVEARQRPPSALKFSTNDL